MTVTYNACVASSARDFGCFLKLLGKWRGSIYKLVWRDLLIFVSLYFSLTLSYRFILTPHQQQIFEKVSYYCEKHSQLIPVSFVLGFYVSLVVGRWWEQYKNVPWIDTLAIWINANLRGNREKDRLLRRTLIRYVNLTMVQCFIMISPRIKKRFPTIEHLVEAGLLLPNEREIIQDVSASVSKYPTNWIPLVWAAGIVTRARAENKIKNDSVANILLTELTKLKDQLNMLISYDWISVPLVYTQVVTLAVYSFFLTCLMGRQWLFNKEGGGSGGGGSGKDDAEGNWLDLFLPFFTILQFLFYMGWLKTAESLLNPFGDDDDDFELNWFVDRNLQIGYLIVDGMQKEFPELLKDQYWDEVVPPELPHTVASEQYKEQPLTGSTSNVVVSEKGAEVIVPASSAGSIHTSQSSHTLLKRGASGKKLAPVEETPAENENLLKNEEDGRVENVDTINFDALTEERPSVGEVFGIEIKVKPADETQGSSNCMQLEEVVVGDKKKGKEEGVEDEQKKGSE